MKKSIAIITLLLGVTTAWAGLIADDFNRVNTAYSTAGSTIGANWVNPSSANKFSISNNVLYMDAVGGGNNCILYNNAQQTLSGSGSSFTLSAQVAGHATVTATWQGVVFNYQNASNYYTLRFKTGAAGYQLLGVSNNATIVVKSGNSTAGNFAAGTLYAVTVASDAAYDFDYSIKSVDGLTTFVSTNSVDANSFFTGGYAGLYLGSAPNPAPDSRFDNFNLTVIPEPATIGMFGLAAVLILLFRRSR
ncbi:MAG: PEP-CTERM sorting domain-containing protein [Kiritimatiellales bacterium]